ncbi:hypothetical protein [Lysobacter gummosus]|uniref:hypothetical protein n=1 Tax=Lysobacter gummosus TaxID=262324 RepID=UPI00362D37FA
MLVIPANAGIQCLSHQNYRSRQNRPRQCASPNGIDDHGPQRLSRASRWIPAFAGMTGEGVVMSRIASLIRVSPMAAQRLVLQCRSVSQ